MRFPRILFIVTLSIILLVGAAYYGILYFTHEKIIDNGKAYEPYTVISEDGHFLLVGDCETVAVKGSTIFSPKVK
jgi:hypothetical protein